MQQLHANLTLAILSLLLATIASAASPNVIVILADDLGYADVGFNGCRDIPTPHIDAIASGGVRCTNAYVSYSVCSPSRAGLLTGRYGQRFGHERNPIYNPLDATMGLPISERTLANVLGDAGYQSSIIGKWHLGAHDIFHPLERGFTEFFGFLGGGHHYFPEAYVQPDDRAKWDEYTTKLIRNRARVEETDYLTRVLSREAVSFVERHQAESFFLFLSYNAPHTPMQAPDETLAKFASIADEKRRMYAAMVSEVDTGVGKLLTKLNELELASNTLLFFLSDNGGPESNNSSDNGPLRGSKGDMYDGGIRVPLAVRWPAKLPAGKVYDKTVSALDIFATAVAVADASEYCDPAKPLDGVDLVGYLTGERDDPPHDALYWRQANRNIRALRQGNTKLTQPKKATEAMLFDLATDIGESQDLASGNPGQVKRLDTLWQHWNEQLVEPAFLGLTESEEYWEAWRERKP